MAVASTRPRAPSLWSSTSGAGVLRDRFVAQAREHILQFDWADVARQTAAVYAQLRGAGVT